MLLAIYEGMLMTPTFLSAEELQILTGRKVKSKQLEALRRMGIPFFVNAGGRPVVTRSNVEGGRSARSNSGWSPSVLGA